MAQLSFQPDPAQQRILDHDARPLLVVGEAGTGKTVVLRERFALLIEGGDADPERVALVVGSKRARLAGRDALRASRVPPDSSGLQGPRLSRIT